MLYPTELRAHCLVLRWNGRAILLQQRYALHGAPLVASLLEPGHSPVGSRRSLLAKQCFALPVDSGLRPSALRANACDVVQNRSRGFVTATVAHPTELRARADGDSSKVSGLVA